LGGGGKGFSQGSGTVWWGNTSLLINCQGENGLKKQPPKSAKKKGFEEVKEVCAGNGFYL